MTSSELYLPVLMSLHNVMLRLLLSRGEVYFLFPLNLGWPCNLALTSKMQQKWHSGISEPRQALRELAVSAFALGTQLPWKKCPGYSAGKRLCGERDHGGRETTWRERTRCKSVPAEPSPQMTHLLTAATQVSPRGPTELPSQPKESWEIINQVALSHSVEGEFLMQQ